MVETRLLQLLPLLPTGISEMYCHPATCTTPALAAAMPGYRHAAELDALTSPLVRQRINELGIGLAAYGDLTLAPAPRHAQP